MSIRIGDTAPDFQTDTSLGPISFHEFLGTSWAILFSHPKDFTPVCTTELGAVGRLADDFHKRDVKAIALSVDSVEEHKKWIGDIEETQNTKLWYPIIADGDRHVSELYGMLDQTNKDAAGLPLTVRSVFFIDPAKKIRAIITYPASTGRNFNEILRVVDSLQLTSRVKVATPADWKKGDDVIIVPSLKDEDAKEIFHEWTTVKPYLRLVKDPQ